MNTINRDMNVDNEPGSAMETTESKSTSARMIIGGIILLLIAGAGVFIIMKNQNHLLAAQTNQLIETAKTGPVIKAIKADYATPQTDLVLMGEATPYEVTTLYAKTAGYVDKIYFDKGDQVKEGQLLATVISPEIDQSYQSAIADLENKKKIEARQKDLLTKNYAAKQDVEASETDVKMAEANVSSLKAQQDYKNIRAPFSGTITARYIDPGALVQNATSSQTSALPVAAIAKIDELRIYVYVEQKDASYIKDGTPVTINLTEQPNLKIEAKVTRKSDALDPKTRMELIEVDIPNNNGQIVAGSYVQVHIHKPASEHIQVPAEALVVQGKNYFLPLIQKDSTLHFQPVTVFSNDGIHAAILSGIQPGDIIGVNVGQTISEGQKVRVQM